MSLNYVIVENEYFALEHLKGIMSKIRPDYKLVFTSESVEDCIQFLEKPHQVDLIFMDIELVDGNCFEIFSKVNVEEFVIFTTAYNQFAIQAFKTNSVDYLLKPIAENSVLASVEKFEKLRKITEKNVDYLPLQNLFNKKPKNRILVNKGDEYNYVEINDIAYFISEDKYIVLVTFSGKKYLTDYVNLNEVENELDISLFSRVSRNLIINIHSIQNVSKYNNGRLLVMINDPSGKNLEAIVSAARKDEFLKWLGGDVS